MGTSISRRFPGAKFDFDLTGHYARSDSFQLAIDDRPKNAAVNIPKMNERL